MVIIENITSYYSPPNVKKSERSSSKKSEEGTSEEIMVRVKSFYLKHNPDKAGSVGKLVKKYKGRYDVLLRQLHEKYGEAVP